MQCGGGAASSEKPFTGGAEHAARSRWHVATPTPQKNQKQQQCNACHPIPNKSPPTMTYTRSSKKQSPAASAAAVQVAARVQKQADKQEKSGKRTQVAKPAVVPLACALTPVKQASAATVATPKTAKHVAPKLIKAAAADKKKVSAANGRRKPAAASGGKVSSTIKKQQRVKASAAKTDAKVKLAASKPSRAQTPMKRAQAGAKTVGAIDRK